jgi:hypothetical protein
MQAGTVGTNWRDGRNGLIETVRAIASFGKVPQQRVRARQHPTSPSKLDAVDAAELAEMLQLLSEWLARDPAHLAVSLEEFVGHPAYGLDGLRGDLERLVFLLGGSDGDQLFGP